MEDKAKKEKLTREQVAAISKVPLVEKVGDMTAKERCEYNNVGRCGACDKDGVFIPCA
ncbi:MAG: hypothetical protein WC615_15335 [Mucilaginibacter sp.]|jgi:hypothetical protein|uniref:hypothetical protein n=1 Tax=Mucilaginibacter sp. TaxID=1882438 RepID=UPI0035667D63